MSKVFDKAVNHLTLTLEGAHSDKRTDRGGLTLWGITEGNRKRWSLPKNLTREDAIGAYKTHFWDKARCDQLSPSSAWLVFDAVVNHGHRLGGKIVQRACGAAVDGKIGPRTVAAINALGARAFLKNYRYHRRDVYSRISAKDLKASVNDPDLYEEHRVVSWGWNNRLDLLQDAIDEAGYLSKPMTKMAQNVTTGAGAIGTTAAVVVAEATGVDSSGSLLDVASAAVSQVNPVVGTIVPVLGGWLARKWARLRGR